MNGLSIKEVAKAANVSKETIRYYESRGLIPIPPRTESGYRIFPKETIKRINFIKHAQELDFTLEEIKKLLEAYDEEIVDLREIKEFTAQKIKEIEFKIRDLQNMKRVLFNLAEKCPDSKASIFECPLIQKFTEGGSK